MGIARIVITDEVRGRGAWRFAQSQKRWTAAIQLYRSIFAQLNLPLLPGDSEIRCTLDEFMAGYDAKLGIDVILTFASGMQSTIQEKFLYTNNTTVTVEYMQDPSKDVHGDWFNMRADYYFVGYDRTNAFAFQDWILLDWPATKRATEQGRIQWIDKQNTRDGAMASFRYISFDDIPSECIVARYSTPRSDQFTGRCPTDWAARKARARALLQQPRRSSQSWADVPYNYQDEVD